MSHERLQAIYEITSDVARIHIRTPVRPTENASKVKSAVLKIFPDAAFIETGTFLEAEATSLDELKEMFRRQRIRDTARSVLRNSTVGIEIRFSLNKQAAAVGRVNFAPPSPLGQIEVTIVDDDPDSIIEFLTGKGSAVSEGAMSGGKR